MAKKIYAVKKGKNIGIFESWDECQRSIEGFSGADFKSFVSVEEAEAYLKGDNIYYKQVQADVANGYVVAYTDGSYDSATKRYAYGVYLFDLKLNEYELCAAYSDKNFEGTNNITGEIFGVIAAMDWALSHEYSKIKIYHDYEGLSKWASGEWKANSPIAQFYVKKLSEKYCGLLQFEFVKVKGHSNNPYNTKADQLADSVLKGGKKIINKGASFYSISNIDKKELDVILDLMCEDNEKISFNITEETNGIAYKLKLGGKSLKLTLFTSGKLLVQGKVTLLFQIFTAYISELIGDHNIIPILKDAYRLTIKTNDVNDGWNAFCYNVPDEYNENLKVLLKQSIINLQYYIESEDYSGYVFPALRALEGHIKYLLQKQGIVVYREFSQFNFDGNTFLLKPELSISDAQCRKDIEKCYSYFNKKRNAIFHFDLIGNTDAAKMINKKSEADEIIKQCLSLINETV